MKHTQQSWRILSVWLVVLAFFLCGMTGAQASTGFVPSAVGDGFGVQIKDGLVSDSDLDRLRSLGFGYVRFSIGWQGIETQKNVYDWQQSDQIIDLVRAHGLKMVIPLLGGNAVYDGAVLAPSRNTDRVKYRPHAPSSPESMQAYARFAANMVLRYGTQDIVWEIWNEPDLARFWPPAPDADSFAVLADVTCQLVRRVAPDARLVGPALGRVPDSRDNVSSDYLWTFLASRASTCLDAVSVHPYRHGAEYPEAVFGDYATLIVLLARHKNYKALIDTEWGYATTQVTPEQQAAYVLRARLTDVLWGVPLSIWYEWRDSRDDPKDIEGHFGLLTYDGKDKPAMQALSDVLTPIQSAVLDRQIQASNPRDILLLLRQPDTGQVLVGWTLREMEEACGVVSFLLETTRQRAVLTAMPQILASGKNVHDISVTEKARESCPNN